MGINRAVDGDIVAIEILPEEEWKRPSDIVLEDKAEDPGKNIKKLFIHSKDARSIV